MTPRWGDARTCSFCGKAQEQVSRLIAGPGVHICDQCIALCNEIIEEETGTPPARSPSAPADRGWFQRSPGHGDAVRVAEVERATKEARVKVSLTVDGSGRAEASTGLPFFDHMLEQLGKHSGFDLSVRAEGDLAVDAHHTVEDVGLAVGEALGKALGDKAGIRRFGSVAVPLDEALVEVAVDLSGRPFVVHEVPVPAELIGTYDPGLTEDFVRALAAAAGMTLHARLISGRAPHHIVEAEFKALARALGDACRVTGPADRGPPSTKGSL